MNNPKICLIGLGYVGLPLAVAFAEKFQVIGFDVNPLRIQELEDGHDRTLEIEDDLLDSVKSNISYASDIQDTKDCDIYIVTVPTPIDKANRPDLTPLVESSKIIGTVLNKNDIVIYESTVYPGVTEDICVPELEKSSGMKFNKDFYCGYSPERINPGDKEHTLSSIIKVSSGSCEVSAENIAKTYELVVDAGVHRAASIKVAEAAKIIENTQRDVNIALVNELSIIFNRLGINTYDVLEAAGTKWNFLKFFPGLVGGHCIGVDPYYLTHKAKQTGYHAKIINSGRYVNDSMGFYVGKQTVKMIIAQGKVVMDAKVLILGATFKEDVSDIRNSKVIDVIKEIESFSIAVDVVDPHANPDEVNQEYGYRTKSAPEGNYDAVILAVNHQEYRGLPEEYFEGLMPNGGVFVDIKGAYKNMAKNNKLEYWSL